MINFDHKAKVFKNSLLQQQLNEEGFIVVDFLSPEELKILKKGFEDLHLESVKGFYSSTFSKEENYRIEVDKLIQIELNRYGLQVHRLEESKNEILASKETMSIPMYHKFLETESLALKVHSFN